MTMLNTLPTVEEMIKALSSPVVPSDSREKEIELTTDEMIKQIFQAVMNPPAVT